MKNCVKGLLVVIAVMLVASPAMAAISVNLQGGGAAVGTQTAGVVAVGNWNDYTDTNPFSSMALVDNSGDATTASFAFSSTGGAIALGVGGWAANIPGDPGSSNMLQGHIYEAGVTLTGAFTGVPYANYDLYVYYNSSSVTNSQTYTLRGTTTSLDGYEVAGLDDALVESDGTNIANYVVFRGLTGSDVTVDATSAGYVYMNGYQIVEVPEPMTIALLSLGGLALIRRRQA